ncbi:MAG: imidazole glycerol phosphate synthase subunit HisH [Curvibacter sp.]|nr:imidazole glycerol phosphate synthase subunit HisH [Curvibacter sp.]
MMVVIDYGAGNIGSVLNMIRYVGGQADVARDAAGVLGANKILLPGVGSFDNAMTRLAGLGMVEPLKARAGAGVPLLGICLGMQLLADASEEGRMAGLGLIPGHVRRFQFDGETAKLKIPHMGWNRVTPVRAHPLAQGLEDGARFYFVHSYFYDCERDEDILLRSVYGCEFTSGVQRGNVMGVQFHPEKSHRYGMQLIRNFVEL